MHNTNVPTLRRSSRVPVTLPILVTSLEPGAQFSEVCETLVVNAHGCAMRSPMKLDNGVPVHFHHQDGRETTAQVVSCQPIGTDRHSWMLGASFDRPDNFWGLKTVPKDWARLSAPGDDKLGSTLPADKRQAMPPDQAAAALKITLDKIRKQLSDDHLKALVAELVGPIEAQVMEIKEKLAQGAKRNRFEVSLSQIPPELEQQLELRLKKELGPQVLKQAREQSEQVLEAAKTAIDRKTGETYDQFRQQVTRDFQAVEQRTQGLSTNVAQNLREHLNRGLGELHQDVVEAGNRLKRLSEDLLGVMEHRLGEEHEGHRRQLEQIRGTVTAESLRLQEQISVLDCRMAKMDESARLLESGLDQRLSKMASDTVRTARGQMEEALSVALNELATRGVQELGNQLDEARANLETIQKGMEASVSESLTIQISETLQSFECRMDELARKCMERWQIAFAGGLNSLVRILGEQFVLQAAPDGNAGQLGSTDKPPSGARR